MEEITGKHKDEKLRKMLREVPLEEPSPDFTNKVMLGIQKEVLQKSTAYHPLISPWIWAIIVMVFALVIVFSLNSGQDSRMAWPDFIDLDLGPAITFLNKIADTGLSKSLSYGAIALALAIFAQLYFLKGQLDKRISVS